MLLAIDIGNTNVTIGLLRGGRLVATRRAATDARATADELELLLDGLLRLDDASFGDVEAIACASVVPALTAHVEAVAARRERPLTVAAAGIVPLAVRVDRPGEVGADRLVNALAAARLYGTPAVVVDFGTATTLDCVATDGAYVGGAIAPGLELGLEALAARTAKLPRIELRAPDRAIGRDTVSAMQSGTIFGYQALATGLLRARPPRARGRRRRRAARGQGHPDRRAVGGAVGRRPRGHRRHRSGPTLKGLAILHAEVAGGERLELGSSRVTATAGRRLDGRLIGLGVTGSIAAYKAVELLRLLRAEGADVAVMLSPAATRFVGPLTFAALSRHPVETDLLELLPDGRIGHIVVADSADAIVVAPATAHWLGAMANGLAGDVVTATTLASAAPVVVAPAMDGEMWTPSGHADQRRAVARRLRLPDRRARGRRAGVGPVGCRAAGRPVDRSWMPWSAAVGSAPVRAPDTAARPPLVDPAARHRSGGPPHRRHRRRHARGHRSGPLHRQSLDRADGVGDRRGGTGPRRAGHGHRRERRGRAAGRRRDRPRRDDGGARRRRSPTSRWRGGAAGFDALVMAAAVADFRPQRDRDPKLERGAGMTLELEPTPDSWPVAGRRGRQLGRRRPGAAAGARRLRRGDRSLERAPEKLRRKGVDLLVANDVAAPGPGSARTPTGSRSSMRRAAGTSCR